MLSSAWKITDTCRFKIVQPPKRPKLPELPREKDKSKEDNDSASMPPPPSPASSTCSDGSAVAVAPPAPPRGTRAKRSVPREEPEDEKVDEEDWPLKDVIFVEDSRNLPVGRVLKVDGPYAAVKFPSTSKEEKEESLLNENTRLLRKDDLQVLKNGSIPRIPDCFQRAPKKIGLQSEGNILALTLDGNGINTIVRQGSKLSHKVFNVSSGKCEVDSKFLTDTNAFLGLDAANGIAFRSTGESEFVSLLTDGNSAIYPLVKDSTPNADCVRNPQMLDLSSLRTFGLGTHALPHVGSGKKNEVAVIVLSFQPMVLLPHILSCDSNAVKRIVADLESEPAAVNTIDVVAKILEERCDGGRNVFHAAVSMCTPTSNKDPDQGETNPGSSGSGGGGGPPGMETMESLFSSSRAKHLEDIMRRAAEAARFVSFLSYFYVP